MATKRSNKGAAAGGSAPRRLDPTKVPPPQPLAAKPAKAQASNTLDDDDFDNVSDDFEAADTEEDLDDAIDALADPDSEPEPEKEPELERTAGGKELFVREPLMVQRNDKRVRLAIGERVPVGMIPRRRLKELGRIGALSVKPPPPPPEPSLLRG